MPMNKKDYPENWDWLSRQVRKRNNNKCELCYAPNNTTVYRPIMDVMISEDGFRSLHPWYDKDALNDYDSIKGALKPTKIVLTVHHINGNKKDSSERNLISLCQRCHLRLDIEKHMKHRKEKKAF